ncbi:MAG: helix-turn-helix transcriptional regulator [Nocardioides sp.]
MVLADSSGHVLDEVVEPGDYTNELDPVSASTSLSMDLRAGSDHVVQVWMDRRHGTFCSRDLAMLSLLTPALQRLLRSRPTARLPGTLTLQEGRVLSLVGAGWTNAEIAERMCVETCTVRKHLEHVYRKLGVSNRMAAAMVLQGRAAGGPRGSSDDDRRQMFA